MTKINLSRYDHFTEASVVFRHVRMGYLYFVEHSEECIKQFTSGYLINKIQTINKIRMINIFLIIGGYFLLTNFCRQASITHAEKLVFSFLAWASINSIRSWGKRIPLYVEFLFICLVGIGIHIFSWYLDILHKIIKNIKQKVFKQIIIDIGCYFIISCLNTCISGAFKITIAQRVRTSMDYLTNNIIRSNAMANSNNTLHPKNGQRSKLFKFYNTSTATIHEVTANTERQARALLGNSKLIFVARKSLQPQITVSRQWGYSYE